VAPLRHDGVCQINQYLEEKYKEIYKPNALIEEKD
jgi:hypothetical protein